MVRGTRIAMVLGAVVLLASACGTDRDTPFSPEGRPAFDGLGTGGNVIGATGTETQSTTTTTSTTSTTGTTTAPDSTSTEGIGGLGTGGN